MGKQCAKIKLTREVHAPAVGPHALFVSMKGQGNQYSGSFREKRKRGLSFLCKYCTELNLLINFLRTSQNPEYCAPTQK